MSLRGYSLLAVALCSACGLFTPKGSTDVARGEYYSAGRPEYDSYFIVLHEKQVELLSAPDEARAARENLASAVGLNAEAPDDALGQRLRVELQKLAAQGLSVRLEVPAPSPALDASATWHTSDSGAISPLRSVLPREATRLVRVRNRMVATKAELQKLRVMGIKLDGGVARAFRTEGPWKREEVRDNLSDGDKLVTLMESRASEVELVASGLLNLLASVATTDPTLGQAMAEPALPAEALRGRRIGPRSRPPERSSPAAPSRPTLVAPGGAAATAPSVKRGVEEDAPPPRPTQGNAPAEIEP